MIEDLLGTGIGDFIFVTLILGGGAAFATGQSAAQSWRPPRGYFPFVLLIACASRFLHYALFDGELLSPTGFVIDLAWFALLATLAYRATRAAKMVRQYPWLYERAGLFGWRARPGAA